MLILHKGLNAEKTADARPQREARRKNRAEEEQNRLRKEAHKQYARGAEILNNSVQKILKIEI